MSPELESIARRADRARRWWNAWTEVGVAAGYSAGPQLPPHRSFSRACSVMSAALLKVEAQDAGVDPAEWWALEMDRNITAIMTGLDRDDLVLIEVLCKELPFAMGYRFDGEVN